MKAIKNFEGLYAIDELGVVYSLPRQVKSKANSLRTTKLKPVKVVTDKRGHRRVQLFKEGKRYNLYLTTIMRNA